MPSAVKATKKVNFFPDSENFAGPGGTGLHDLHANRSYACKFPKFGVYPLGVRNMIMLDYRLFNESGAKSRVWIGSLKFCHAGGE